MPCIWIQYQWGDRGSDISAGMSRIRGVPRTVLFTTNNREGFENYCTEVVLLPSLKHLNHGNVISPQFPILVMLDIIYAYYMEQNKYLREEMHDSTLRSTGRKRKQGKETISDVR